MTKKEKIARGQMIHFHLKLALEIANEFGVAYQAGDLSDETCQLEYVREDLVKLDNDLLDILSAFKAMKKRRVENDENDEE